jgi:hypothetical protein
MTEKKRDTKNEQAREKKEKTEHDNQIRAQYIMSLSEVAAVAMQRAQQGGRSPPNKKKKNYMDIKVGKK